MKYFDMSEFACKHCGRLPENGMSPALLEALDKLREAWGGPIIVSSGWRCKEHNAEIGGVSNSQHTLGTAADIYTVGGYNEYRQLLQLARDMRLFDASGEYNTSMFIHLDQRDGGTNPNYYSWIGD